MCISSLSISEQGFIVCLSFISLAVITVCLMMKITQQKHKKHIVLSLVVFLLNGVHLASLMEIARDCRLDICAKMSPVSAALNQIPHYLHYGFLLASFVFSVFMFFVIKKSLKQDFSASTVRQAIENLPTGLAFYDENGFLHLSNHIMHKLSIDLTTKDLQNGVELENDLKSLQQTDACEINGEEPAFWRNDGSIWQFSKSLVEIEGKPFTELRADDITEIYHLSDEIRETNERLSVEKIRLAEHMKNIGKYISEQEALRVKMAVHDDFGELIARTVRAYERKANREEKSQVITAWSKVGQKMNRILTFDQRQINSIEKVKSLAKELDCKIKFTGTFPNNFAHNHIIISAIFESLKNAVHHAKADEIFVTFTNNNNKITTFIYNEGKKTPKYIVEGGGLTALREKVEKAGGTMEISCGQGVTLCVTL